MSVSVDFVSGLVASFVSDGVRRVVRNLAGEITRRPKLTRILSDTAKPPVSTSASYDAALAELCRLIAHSCGEYTETIDTFFRALNKTAIPDALVHHALSDTSPDMMYPAFERIYQTCSPLSFECKPLFYALFETIALRIQDSVSDRALLDIIRAQHSDLTKQIKGIAHALAQAKSLPHSISAAEVEKARLSIAKLIESSQKFLTVETSHGLKKVPIQTLVIPARLRPFCTSGLSGPATKTVPDDTVSLLHFRQSFYRAVILGDPGGGKSTLTQYISFELSRQIRLEAQHPAEKYFDSRDLRIPLRVVLRTLEGRKKKNPSYNILDYLTDDVRDIFDNNTTQSTAVLTHLLTLGGALIIFDGLDEILEVNERRRHVAEIERFSVLYASCPILITSRIVGYKDALLSDDFAEVELTHFNRDEIKTFTERLIGIVKRCTKLEASSEAARFVRQTETLASELRKNPLMLGLMVYLFCYRGDVPSHKPEIYKECALLMFERWDNNRSIIFDRPTDFDLLDLFSSLARSIFGDPEREEGVSRDWLKLTLRCFFEEYYVDKPRAVQTANALLDFVTGRAWVLCEVGPKIYKFTHRTFLEFFFARDLISRSSGISDLINGMLIPRIKKSEWEVIGHLALHTAVYRDGGKMRQARDVLITLVSDQTIAKKHKLSIMHFSSAALEYLVVSERSFIELVQEIFRSAVAFGGFNSFCSQFVIYRLVSSTYWREELVKNSLGALISHYISDGTEKDICYCLYLAAGCQMRMPQYHPDMLDLSWSSPFLGNFFEQIYSGRKGQLIDLAKSNVLVARAWVAAFSEDRVELYRIHGGNLLIPSGVGEEPPMVNNILGLLIVEGIQCVFSDRRGAPSLRPLTSDIGMLMEKIALDISLGQLIPPADITPNKFNNGMSHISRLLGRQLLFRVANRPSVHTSINDICNIVILWLFMNDALGLKPDEWGFRGRKHVQHGFFKELLDIMPTIKRASNFSALAKRFQAALPAGPTDLEK